MELRIKVEGMRQLAKNFQSIVPDPVKARSMLNRSLSYAVRKTILQDAKRNLRSSRASGALEQAVKVRARSRRQALRKGVTASTQVGILRSDPQAAAIYANHYGRLSVIESGIRHGHLIEFGFHHKRSDRFIPGDPWLGPAAFVNERKTQQLFMASVRRKLELRVRRMKKK